MTDLRANLQLNQKPAPEETKPPAAHAINNPMLTGKATPRANQSRPAAAVQPIVQEDPLADPPEATGKFQVMFQ